MKLGVVLSIKTIQDFKLFEKTIAMSQEKKKVLCVISKNIEITLK